MINYRSYLSDQSHMMLGMAVVSFTVMVLMTFSMRMAMTMSMGVSVSMGLLTNFILRFNFRGKVHWDRSGNDLREASCEFFEVIKAKHFVRAMSIGLRA